MNVIAIKMVEKNDSEFLLFSQERTLFLFDIKKQTSKEICQLPEFNLDKKVEIYFHAPFCCIVERYGLKAYVINMESNSITEFSREDYHAGVSSFSIGFFEKEGEVFLIHQSQWNKLDVTNLTKNQLLTERLVKAREIGERPDGTKVYEYINYINYFHSRLHMAPDGKHFLSNGWVWHPVNIIMSFNTEQFLREYEKCGVPLDYFNDYNWDRPCTFIDNNTFLIAADLLKEVKDPTYKYHQFLFYNVNNVSKKGQLLPVRFLDVEAFKLNENKEVKGELFYDEQYKNIIALSDAGAKVYDMGGNLVTQNSQIKASAYDYSSKYHIFYTYNNSSKKIETISLEYLITS